jgi:predicted NAD-dependent protein-ADP-ribosyltransferase YbiA (DUF1768 family)
MDFNDTNNSLSPFASNSFSLKGIKYRSVYNFYLSKKFSDAKLSSTVITSDKQTLLRTTDTRKYRLVQDWSNKRYAVMREAYTASISQNPRLKQYFLNIEGDCHYVAHPNFTYWCYPGGDMLCKLIREIAAGIKSAYHPGPRASLSNSISALAAKSLGAASRVADRLSIEDVSVNALDNIMEETVIDDITTDNVHIAADDATDTTGDGVVTEQVEIKDVTEDNATVAVEDAKLTAVESPAASVPAVAKAEEVKAAKPAPRASRLVRPVAKPAAVPVPVVSTSSVS